MEFFLVYLFVYFLQDLFPLSKVRGATEECVSSEQGKTNTSSSYSADWDTDLSFN